MLGVQVEQLAQVGERFRVASQRVERERAIEQALRVIRVHLQGGCEGQMRAAVLADHAQRTALQRMGLHQLVVQRERLCSGADHPPGIVGPVLPLHDQPIGPRVVHVRLRRTWLQLADPGRQEVHGLVVPPHHCMFDLGLQRIQLCGLLRLALVVVGCRAAGVGAGLFRRGRDDRIGGLRSQVPPPDRARQQAEGRHAGGHELAPMAEQLAVGATRQARWLNRDRRAAQQRLEVVGQLGHRGVAVAGRLGHGLALDQPEPVRRMLRHALDRHRLLVEDLVVDLDRAVAMERQLACRRLVEQYAERELVRLRADLRAVALDLLRGHVERRAQDRAVTCQQRVLVQVAGQAKIGDLGHALAVEDDVGRLDVTVQDPLVVRIGQALADLQHQLETLLERSLAKVEDLFERAALDQLHREEVNPLLLSDLQNRDDVGVTQPGQGLGFALESRHLGPVRLRRVQHLERHDSVQSLLTRSVDDAHSAAADLLQHLEVDQVGDLCFTLLVADTEQGRLMAVKVILHHGAQPGSFGLVEHALANQDLADRDAALAALLLRDCAGDGAQRALLSLDQQSAEQSVLVLEDGRRLVLADLPGDRARELVDAAGADELLLDQPVDDRCVRPRL